VYQPGGTAQELVFRVGWEHYHCRLPDREVKPVSQAPVRTRTHARHTHAHHLLKIDGEGKSHPLIDAAGAYAVLAGLTAFIIGMLDGSPMAGSILGITGFLVGIVGQMLSVTRIERIVLVFGIVASFIGAGIAFAHGGFS
jgi:uncharacterized membrane protein YjjP (DUF1212 family)